MTTIDVSDALWTYLQQHAQPSDETPTATLERLLGIAQRHLDAAASARPVGPHAQRAFREPLLHVLAELGGRAPKRDVLARLADVVPLTAADYERNLRGHRRWERRIAAAAADLRREGLLAHTQHGVWALTAAGRAST